MTQISHSTLTPAQATTALLNFADTLLSLLAGLRDEDRAQMGALITDVSQTLRRLAYDIAGGDPDIAFEVMRSAARLISVLRLAVNRRPAGSRLH
jgi:hypothetical protein